MTAHDDACGCGEYSCTDCFENDNVASADLYHNAWVDEAFILESRNPILRANALRRWEKYMGMKFFAEEEQ